MPDDGSEIIAFVLKAEAADLVNVAMHHLDLKCNFYALFECRYPCTIFVCHFVTNAIINFFHTLKCVTQHSSLFSIGALIKTGAVFMRIMWVSYSLGNKCNYIHENYVGFLFP